MRVYNRAELVLLISWAYPLHGQKIKFADDTPDIADRVAITPHLGSYPSLLNQVKLKI